jgi:hypothetical protein
MQDKDVFADVIGAPDVELFESEEVLKHPDRDKKKVLLIFIKTIDDRKQFRFRENELINRVKIHAMRRFGIDVSQAPLYFFLFQGRRLDETKTLEQEQIPDRAELFLKNEPAVG